MVELPGNDPIIEGIYAQISLVDWFTRRINDKTHQPGRLSTRQRDILIVRTSNAAAASHGEYQEYSYAFIEEGIGSGRYLRDEPSRFPDDRDFPLLSISRVTGLQEFKII